MAKSYAFRVRYSVVKELMQEGLTVWIKVSRTLLNIVVHFFLAKNQQTQNLSSCQFMTNTQVIYTTQTLLQQCTVFLVKDSFL